MKKLVTALAALGSLASAQIQDVSATAKDVVPQLDNYLGLEIRAYNPRSVSRKIRATYELPEIEAGANARYKVDNLLHPDMLSAFGANCKIDHNKVDSLVYTIKRTDNGKYFLDMQFDLKPQDDKTFCFPIMRTDLASFETGEIVNSKFKYMFARPGSPLDNPVVYNYIPKARASYKGLNPAFTIAGLPHAFKITANVISNGTNPAPDAETLSAWDCNQVANVPATILIDLGVDSYGMYKDTRMLVTSVGPLADHYRWNESTFDGHMYNDVEERTIFMGRCWLITAFNMYSYFYGNRNTKPDAMTQDEMLYLAATMSGRDRQNGVFMPNDNEGGYLSTTAKLVNRIMPNTEAKSHSISKEPLSGSMLLEMLAEGTPIPFTILGIKNNEDGTATHEGAGHAMLLDALAITATGDTLVHIINTDNFGNERYVYLNLLKQHWDSYMTYTKPTRFERTDAIYPVDQDFDNDGIVDFDEHYRFLSDPNEKDSDHDGIPDREEIYAYTTRAELQSRDNLEASKERYQFESYPIFLYNYNNPKNFPQMNDDFDGDGIKDGDEDQNGNGIYEPELGETDPFVKNDATVADIPNNITLYAIETINLGSNTFCQQVTNLIPTQKVSDDEKTPDKGNCNVAATFGITGEPAIRVGANVILNNIFVNGSAEILESAKVLALSQYNPEAWVDDLTENQEMFVISKSPVSWPFKPIRVLPQTITGTKSVIVEDGETLEVNDEDVYASVVVKKGGSIKFNDGEMHINSLQLDYGSTYSVQSNGYSTILHLDGPVQWYAENAVKSDEYEGECHNSGCVPNQKIKSIAESFKVYQHSDKDMYVDTRWAGTIIAPDSKLHLGMKEENSDIIAGQFLARAIDVLPNTDIHHIVYDPIKKETAPAVTPLPNSKPEKAETPETEEPAEETLTVPGYNVAAQGNLSIVSMSRNELMFETASASRYQVFIAKANGSKAAAYTFDKGNVGINFVSLADAKLTRGNYFVTIKQNGRTSSKMLVIK